MSSKKEFFASLNEEQKKFVECLLDEAFARGMSEGKMEERIVYNYGSY